MASIGFNKEPEEQEDKQVKWSTFDFATELFKQRQDLENLRSSVQKSTKELEELKKDVRDKTEDLQKRMGLTHNLVLLGFMLALIMLVGVMVALFPVFKTYFYSHYLYQYQVEQQLTK